MSSLSLNSHLNIILLPSSPLSLACSVNLWFHKRASRPSHCIPLTSYRVHKLFYIALLMDNRLLRTRLESIRNEEDDWYRRLLGEQMVRG